MTPRLVSVLWVTRVLRRIAVLAIATLTCPLACGQLLAVDDFRPGAGGAAASVAQTASASSGAPSTGQGGGGASSAAGTGGIVTPTGAGGTGGGGAACKPIGCVTSPNSAGSVPCLLEPKPVGSCVDGPWNYCLCSSAMPTQPVLILYPPSNSGPLQTVVLYAPAANGPYSLSLDGFCAGGTAEECPSTGPGCVNDRHFYRWQSINFPAKFGNKSGSHTIEIWAGDQGYPCVAESGETKPFVLSYTIP